MNGRSWYRSLRRLTAMPLTLAFAANVGLLDDRAMAQWTQWGGPHSNFLAESGSLAKSWPTEGPRAIWSRDLGDGYSSILVDDGRLYTMCRVDGKETVICLNAKNGETVWQYQYDSAPAEGHVAQFGEGPRATPLIVGDRLYTIGVAGVMHCLNKADGKSQWSHDLWKDFAGNKLPHGYASSPIAYKDTVIALVGGKDAGIVAFDQKSGEVRWKGTSFENSYSTPRIYKVDGADQLITFMATEAVGVDPNTGKLLWQFAHENQWKQNICMPALVDDVLLISSSEAGARGLQLKHEGDAWKADEIWATRKVQFYHVTAVQDGDWVYGSTGAMAPNFLAGINVRTGDIAWRERGFAKANCVLADGRLIILDEDGNLGLATATPEALTVHSRFRLFEDVSWTVPTIVDKTLYVRDKKLIKALDLG